MRCKMLSRFAKYCYGDSSVLRLVVTLLSAATASKPQRMIEVLFPLVTMLCASTSRTRGLCSSITAEDSLTSLKRLKSTVSCVARWGEWWFSPYQIGSRTVRQPLVHGDYR